MNQFLSLISSAGRQAVLVVAQRPHMNHQHRARLQGYRPTYWVSAGLMTANLDKVDVSPKSGRTVAYYSIVCRNPMTGQRERYAWRYSVWNGRCVEEKAFPVKFG